MSPSLHNFPTLQLLPLQTATHLQQLKPSGTDKDSRWKKRWKRLWWQNWWNMLWWQGRRSAFSIALAQKCNGGTRQCAVKSAITTGKLTQPKVHEFLNFTTYKDARDYSKKDKGTIITMSTSDEYIIHMSFWNMALFYPLMIVTIMRHNAYCFYINNFSINSSDWKWAGAFWILNFFANS